MVEKIILCGEDFEQDVRPLVQAFSTASSLEVIKVSKLPEVINEAVLALEINEGYIYTACNPGVLLENREKIIDNEHKELRNQILRAVYRLLSEAEDKQLPWGILTGVRPSKLILEQLEQGSSYEDIIQRMRGRYYCSEEKTKLAIAVAEKEKRLMSRILLEDTYSIYVGIPFCPSICNYCSFSSYPLDRYGKLTDDYVKALAKEIECSSGFFPEKKPTTVYFGGGTPTTLETEQLRFLIRHVKKYFPMDMVSEFTVEAGRADTITEEKLLMLREEGISRISINPQSMREETLRLIGRKHTPEQVTDAFKMARRLGFNNINMDIILGLSGETPEDVAYTLSEIDKLSPEGLTVHTLAKKRAARLTTESKVYKGLEATDVVKMLELSQEYTKQRGYEPYYMYRQKYMSENLENIGYSKPGFECLYNILIMEERQVILALGAGASSKFVFNSENRFERVENVKNIPDYISRIDEMIERKTTFLREQYVQERR